jgi:epoxyqueuosine reductase QueG
MKRTEELRRNPHRLVPWAVSIISVGMNFLYPLFPSGSSASARKAGFPYAWGDDYHLIRTSWSLSSAAFDMCDGPVEGKAFVDSGPVWSGSLPDRGVGWIGKTISFPQRARGFGRTFSQHTARL